MTTSERKTLARAPHLDGLRGWAAVTVLIGHLAMMVWPSVLVSERYALSTPSWQLGLAASPLSAFWDGRLAVSIFFVLSGYVLTSAVTARQSSFVALAGKRYVRLLLPVLAATLPTLLLQPQGWYFNHELAFVTGSDWMDSLTSTGFHPTLLSWLRNAFLVVFFVDGHSSYNALLWTMKFEWYGSLLIFLLASISPRVNWRLPLAAILLICLAEVPTYAILHLFLVGMILHDLTVWLKARRQARTASTMRLAEILGYFLVGFGLYLPRLIMVMVDAQGTPFAILLWLRQAFPSWQGDRWMIAAVPIVAGVLISQHMKHWLSRPLCQFLGRISFSLYLFHLPIILSLGSWLLLSLLPHMSLTVAACSTFVATAMVALAVAWAMTYLVEIPTLRLAARFGAVLDTAWGRVCPWRRLQVAKDLA